MQTAGREDEFASRLSAEEYFLANVGIRYQVIGFQLGVKDSPCEGDATLHQRRETSPLLRLSASGVSEEWNKHVEKAYYAVAERVSGC